jgi:capsular polysaccharide transport system permease protein
MSSALIPSNAGFLKTPRAVAALVLREMATTYGRSPGGYIWAILEPVAGTALLTFLFSIAFNSPPIGENFPLFYATGLLPFLFYLEVSGKVSQSISFSRPLLFYPTVTYLDTILARFLLNFITQVLVFAVVIGGIIIFYDLNPITDITAAFLALLMAGSLALGVGSLNCFLISMFPLWARIWAILNRPLFIISGIFFVFETIPQPFRDALWYNPIVHVIGMMRRAFYATYEASFVSVAFVFGVSGFCFMLSLIFLNRYHRHILNN